MYLYFYFSRHDLAPYCEKSICSQIKKKQAGLCPFVIFHGHSKGSVIVANDQLKKNPANICLPIFEAYCYLTIFNNKS